MVGNESVMKVLFGVFLAVGLLFVLGGINDSAPANSAPTLVGIACFCGIVARIIQAHWYQIEHIKELDIDRELNHPED